MRVEIFARTSYGRRDQSAVMASSVGDRAQDDRVAVGAAVALDADGADVGEQDHRALPDVAVRPAAVSSSRAMASACTEEVEAVLGDLADDPDTEAGAGERLALDHRLRQAQLLADPPDLVLEEVAERLDQGNSRSSGRPPTLWWDLMLAVPVPPPDSTTSG